MWNNKQMNMQWYSVYKIAQNQYAKEMKYFFFVFLP